MGDTYDLLPHEEVLFLRQELKRLQDEHGLPAPDHDPRAEGRDGRRRLPHPKQWYDSDVASAAANLHAEFAAAMNRLSINIEALLRLVEEAKKDLGNAPAEEKPAAKLFTDPKILDRLKAVEAQNQKIAEGIVSVAHIVKDAFGNLEPYRAIAERLDRIELLINLLGRDGPKAPPPAQPPTGGLPQLISPINFREQQFIQLQGNETELEPPPEGPAVESREVGLFESHKLLPPEPEPADNPFSAHALQEAARHMPGYTLAPPAPSNLAQFGLMPPPLPPSAKRSK